MDSEAAQLPLSDRLLAWFETHRQLALWGAVALLAGGLIIGYLVWRQGELEIEAAQALTNVSAPYNAGVANRSDVAEAYVKVANTYPKSKVAARAILLAGGEYFSQNKFDQAKSMFEKFRREHGDNPLIPQAQLGIAACLEAQGKTAEAIAAYKDLIERKLNDITVPQAKFALANLYEADNKPELAFNLFEEIVRADPYSSLGSVAGMRAERLKQKYPKLAAPPPAPPNANPLLSTPRPGPLSNTPAPIAPTRQTLTNAPAPGTAPGPALTNAAPVKTNK